MATGDRRLGSSTRRGMTVLGKIPAVPKPINLPSQRLENRGLDPSVEIVPRGTFSWGTGRSPPTSGSSWGNVGLSSSPPVGTGAWNTASTSAPISSSNNSSGAQNPPRPLSAGSTRPSSAGTLLRPLSASTTSGRAWGGAAKLEEQFQPSRFNLTTAEFPTLGSEKNPNLRPQQNTAPSNRPTSADATKERNLAYADHYQSGTLADRPTSADGSKDWKAVYPEVQPAARPTSADGAHSDKGGQQPALRLPVRSQFPDGRLPDQGHPFYTGVVGHGTAGPGPGTLDQPKDNFSNHPLPVQHGRAAQGREFVFPGASQHDPYFKRPGGPHGNDVVVLPLDARPEVYGSYAFDSRPNHPDMSRVHHPHPSWGPNHLERPGIHQGQFLQPGSAEHFHIMQPPQRRRMETAVMHEQQPVIGNRRDGFGIGEKAFGEQRVGWGGTNVVYVRTSQDVREASIPMSGTGSDFPRPNMFLSSWGHQPMHAGWGNMYGGDMTVGMYQEMPSSVIHQQGMVMEAMPQGSVVEEGSEKVILEKSNEKGTAHADEVVHASSLGGQPVGGHQAEASGNTPTVGQDVQHSKQEEAIKTSSVKIAAAGPDVLRNRNNIWARGGPLAGNQASKTKQGGEGTRAEQNTEAQKMNSSSNLGFQKQEDNSHGKFQGSNQDQVVANKDGNNGSGEEVKATPRKKILSSLQSTKGIKESDSSEREERTPFSKASDRTLNNSSNLSSADLPTTPSKERENDLRDTCTDGFSQTSQNRQLKSTAKDPQIMSTLNCEVSVGAPVSEEEKVPLDDGSKITRNGQSARRAAHHGRSVNELHSVDRQHVNHGMVWAPKPTGAAATKEESQLPGGDTSDLHEAMQKSSADVAKKGRMQQQPLREHESQGKSQVQQMQSAMSSQQGQGQQVQEHSVVSSKKSVQQKGERSSKKQGHRAQQHQASSSVSQQPVQEEQPALNNSKSQSLQMKPQQPVVSSHVEFARPPSQEAAFSQREALSRKNLPTQEAEKDGEVVGTAAPNKFDGKRNKEEDTVYMRKPARNQHRQQHEQPYEAVNNYHGQRSYPKEEKSVAEDLETPASEMSAFSGTELRKNQKEVRSRNSRNNFKQQKGDLQEPAASLVSEEGPAPSGDRPHLEARGEIRTASLAAETKAVKDKEDRTHNQKFARQQEMHMKQSATGSHQEHRHFGEEVKADAPSSESTTIRNEKKLYVPKQARKQYLQQEYEATGPHGQGRQRRIQEVYATDEKGQYDGQGSQPSGIQTSIKKGDMEWYTPVQARQPNMQGQQSATQGQRGQRTQGDLTTRASSVHVGSMSSLRDLAHISDTMGKGDESQPCGATGPKDERKIVAESSPSKKEAKHYIVKSGGQHQQYPSNVHEEAPAKEEKWLKPHQTSATDSIKRKEGMQLYTPKHARQEETSLTLGGKVSKEAAAEPSVAEQHDPDRNGKEEGTREFDHSHKNRNHSTKGGKSAPFHHAHKRNQPPLEDRYEPQPTLEDSVHVSRVEETNGSIREHKKDQESGDYRNMGFRRGHRDAKENPNFEDAEIPKPRQYQRRQYQYQPVAQHLPSVKPQAEDSIAHRPNTKQVDHGYSRYERREGSRRGGRGHGYGYRAGDNVEPSDAR